MKRLLAGTTLLMCLIATGSTSAQQPDTQQSRIREIIQAQQKPWDCRNALRNNSEFTSVVRVGSGVLTAVAEKHVLPTGDSDSTEEQVVRV
jgi:hypothetical protein